MKIIAQYFKLILGVMVIAFTAFRIQPRDFDILIASLVCTGITAILSLSMIAVLYEEKSRRSVAIKSLAMLSLGVEIIAGMVILSAYQGSIFDDAPTWLKQVILMPASFAIFLSALILGKVSVNSEANWEPNDHPYRDFSEKIGSHSPSNLVTHEISALLPIPNSEDKIVMLKYIGAFQNVLHCKPDGLIVWQAELPKKSNDVYTNIEWKDGHLMAFSRSCIAVNLDVETGKIPPEMVCSNQEPPNTASPDWWESAHFQAVFRGSAGSRFRTMSTSRPLAGNASR